MTFIPDRKLYDTAIFFKSTMPTLAYAQVAKMPFIGGPIMKKNAEKLMKINKKTRVLGDLFSHFTTNSWIFESLKIPAYAKKMSP